LKVTGLYVSQDQRNNAQIYINPYPANVEKMVNS